MKNTKKTKSKIEKHTVLILDLEVKIFGPIKMNNKAISIGFKAFFMFSLHSCPNLWFKTSVESSGYFLLVIGSTIVLIRHIMPSSAANSKGTLSKIPYFKKNRNVPQSEVYISKVMLNSTKYWSAWFKMTNPEIFTIF